LTETLEQVPRVPTGPRPARLCPECKGAKLIRDYDTAEVVCMTCGFVDTDKIADSRPEWRAFDDEQRAKRARTGAPMTFTIHDKGLSTIIDWRDRPSGTKSVSADQRIELYKLRKWQRRVRVSDATERNLAVALSELSKLSAALTLPKNILETASVIYRRAINIRSGLHRDVWSLHRTQNIIDHTNTPKLMVADLRADYWDWILFESKEKIATL